MLVQSMEVEVPLSSGDAAHQSSLLSAPDKHADTCGLSYNPWDQGTEASSSKPDTSS